MKRIYTLILLLIVAISAKAQESCLTEIQFQEDAAKNPSLLKGREQLEKFTESWIAQHGGTTSRTPGTPYIIPVVFHVIHYNGPEKIGRDQIVSQVDSLNKDYRYHNADTVNTPAVFRPLAADCNIEFRLAQKDPNGNCTDGVTYTYSPLTYNARSNVKSLIRWPTDQYLNIWTVSTIITSNGVVVPGTYVAGFAQFPGGADTTDGVVLRADFVGSIGSAAGNNDHGRTATHEVGHWFNLRHIWGDATCGNDMVADTPPQEQSNISLCPSWPHLSNCTGNSPNGDLYVDHMDYTDGACKTMFSLGQSARMDAALNSGVSGRNNLYTTVNLTATGTDGTPAVLCSPHADFIPRHRFVCPGGSLSFKDESWNGAVSSRTWTFQGGIPASDTSANPTVTYNSPGTYDVVLSVTNSAGTDTKTIPGMVTVSDPNATVSVPFSEGFESGAGFPYTDWFVINANQGNTWEETPLAAFSGSQSLLLRNISGNDKGFDEFITPAFDFSNVAAPTMKFKYAFAFVNATTANDDKLVVSFSTDCGKTWTVRLTKGGPGLPTVANVVASSFIPVNTSQWDSASANIATLGGQPNIRFKFEFTHNFGNNIYIDDINIGGVVGIDELNAQQSNVNIYPNPSSESTTIAFSTIVDSNVKMELMDISGRIIKSMEQHFNSGEHQIFIKQNPEPGVYLVKLSFGETSISKKLIVR